MRNREWCVCRTHLDSFDKNNQRKQTWFVSIFETFNLAECWLSISLLIRVVLLLRFKVYWLLWILKQVEFVFDFFCFVLFELTVWNMQLAIASVLILCIGLSAALPGTHFTRFPNSNTLIGRLLIKMLFWIHSDPTQSR